MDSHNSSNWWINSKFSGVLLIIVILPITGCVTTMGYIPEYIKSDGKPATYEQARKWATDVMDGYDSRATMNRQALYGGSILAALGASALTGLTLSHTRGTALSAVPLGFGFLGGIAALYQNDEKATIFSRASRSVKALILMSDDRLTKLSQDQKANKSPESESSEVKSARQALSDAEIAFKNAQATEKEYRNSAIAARREANEAINNNSPEEIKQAKQEKAKAAEDLENQATIKFKNADAARVAAKSSVDNAIARWKGGDFEKSEAICLQKDVNSIMSKVEEHLLFLDPKKVADTLRAVKAVDLTKGAAATETIKLPPIDYSDIDPANVKSACP